MRAFLDRFVGNLSPSALLVSILFWSWCDLVPYSPLLPQAASSEPYAWVPITSLLLSAAVLACYALNKRLRSLSLQPAFFAAASLVCGGIGSLLIYVGFAVNATLPLLAGAVLTGLYQGMGATVSGCIAVCQGKTNALIHIAACLPFNVVFVLLGMFLQPVAAVVLCGILPLLATLAYKVFLVRGTNDQLLATVTKTPARTQQHPRYTGSLVLLLLITTAFGFMEGQDSPAAPDAFGVAFLDYASLFVRGVCALVVFCAYVFYSRQPQTFLIVAIALMAGGLLILGPAAPLGTAGIVGANLLVITGYAIFDLLIWAILVIMHHGSSVSMRRFLCAAYAVDSLGIFLGMLLAATVPGEPWTGLVGAALGVALLATAFAVLSRPHSVRTDLSGALPIELHGELSAEKPPQPHASATSSVAARYFLTEREESVLGLLLAGRSAPYIAEQLCVSQNTVKTHVRHIYAKLDIHTRQELLDLVRGEG